MKKKRYDIIEHVEKFNPYHDSKGRFSTAQGSSFMTIRTRDPNKQHMADMAIARAKDGAKNDSRQRIKNAEKELESILIAGAETNLTGMDPDVAEATVKTVKTIIERYPSVKGAFHGFTTEEPHFGLFDEGSKTMGAYNSATKQIYLNPHYFGNKEKFEKAYNDSVEHNFHPKGTKWDSVVAHEMGHAIDEYVSFRTIDKQNYWWNGERISSRIWNNNITNGKKKGEPVTGKSIMENLSGYAGKNHAEYFAEGIAEYLMSPNPRPTATHIGKRMEFYIKKMDKQEGNV